jgi:hypothetical protein
MDVVLLLAELTVSYDVLCILTELAVLCFLAEISVLWDLTTLSVLWNLAEIAVLGDVLWVLVELDGVLDTGEELQYVVVSLPFAEDL